MIVREGALWIALFARIQHTDITRSIFLPLCQQGTIHHTLFTRPVKSHYFPAPLQTIKRTLPSSWSLGRSCYKVNTLIYKRNDHKNLLRPHTGHTHFEERIRDEVRRERRTRRIEEENMKSGWWMDVRNGSWSCGKR